MKELLHKARRAWPWQSLNLPFSLQTREKIILMAGAVLLAIFLLLQLVVFPIMDHRSRLKALLASHNIALAEILVLKAEKEELARSSEYSETQLKKRQKGFNLFSFLESLAVRSGIRQIESMKPSSANLKNSPYTLTRVDMKINGLTMEQLIPFLHHIETSNQIVWIKGISITRNEKNEGVINALLHVETIER
jgi:general secretion pathway protein M